MAIVGVTRYVDGYGKFVYDYCRQHAIKCKGWGSSNGLNLNIKSNIWVITQCGLDCNYFINYGYSNNQNDIALSWFDHHCNYKHTLINFSTKTFNQGTVTNIINSRNAQCSAINLYIDYDPLEFIDPESGIDIEFTPNATVTTQILEIINGKNITTYN
jgi:hypothetical protein